MSLHTIKESVESRKTLLNMYTINKYVTTGGPVGGKTSFPPYALEHFSKAGIKTFFTPEAATHVFGIGYEINHPLLQETILQSQLFFERQAEIASNLFVQKTGRPAIIICDRGIFDIKAYMPNSKFKELLEQHNLEYIPTRDSRYKGIIHFETTAKGKEEIYLKEFHKNPKRNESPAKARQKDNQVKQAWNGTPHIWVADNSTGFEEKKQKAVNFILHMQGLPEPKEIEFKYLIDPKFKKSMIPEYTTDVLVEQTYLQNSNPDIEERVRRRGQYNSFVFIHTIKEKSIDGEWEEFIEANVYKKLLGRRILEKEVIEKTRTLFMSDNQYFELDTFKEKIDENGSKLLELEATNKQTMPVLPKWIEPYIVEEVTGNSFYSNSVIASRLWEAKQKK